MSVRIYQHGGDISLTGAGTTPCLRWSEEQGRWRSQPAELPEQAERLTPENVPDDLREELLAFVTRADAMGAAMTQFGN